MKCWGMLAGYAVGIVVDRCKDKDTLGVWFFIYIDLPLYFSGLTTELEGGFPLRVSVEVLLRATPSVSKHSLALLVGSNQQGWGDIFGKPWAETVRDGSPHFPDGKLEIKASARLAVQKHY